MRRWRGNGRLYPEGGKTSLRACEGTCEARRRGCKPGPDIEAPKRPSSPASAGRRPAKKNLSISRTVDPPRKEKNKYYSNLSPTHFAAGSKTTKRTPIV